MRGGTMISRGSLGNSRRRVTLLMPKIFLALGLLAKTKPPLVLAVSDITTKIVFKGFSPRWTASTLA